jgi:Zn-dependent protease
MDILSWIALLVFSIVIHEYSHGLTAALLGDDTAKRAGRLTLNPLRHLDPFWTVALPVLLYFSTNGRFVFAMAKPVPVDFSRLHEPKTDMGFVGAAGPFANFALAGLFSVLWKLYGTPFLVLGVYLNLGLAVFNLLPLPPLDGSRVLASLLPPSWARRYLGLEPFGYLLILALYFTGILTDVMLPLVDTLGRFLGVPPLSTLY